LRSSPCPSGRSPLATSGTRAAAEDLSAAQATPD
jgi:hypothetical protein